MPRTIVTSTDSYHQYKELAYVAYHYLHLGFEPGWSHVGHIAGLEITAHRSSQISVYLALNSTLHT